MIAVALVTGAGGQVGRALVATAPPHWQVVAASRSEIDISDQRAVARALDEVRPTLVINCAAFTKVDLAEADPESADRVNAQGAEAVARATRALKGRLIHLSTDMVFDGSRGAPYGPSDPPAPISVYGQSKLRGERLVLSAAPEALILRTAWVYDLVGRNFVRAITARLEERDEVGVVTDQIGTPTWAASLACAIWRAADLPTLAGIHHWTDAGVASWYDFAVAIREELLSLGRLSRAGRVVPIPTAGFPLPARRPPCAVLDKSATWAVLGTPPHWREQLRTMLAGTDAA